MCGRSDGVGTAGARKTTDMAHHLIAGDITKSGHRMVMVLDVSDDRVLARDADGDERWLEVSEQTKVAGRAKEGLYVPLGSAEARARSGTDGRGDVA